MSTWRTRSSARWRGRPRRLRRGTRRAALDLAELAFDQSVLLWPGPRRHPTYSGSYRLGDYNGDGADDLLCHHIFSGDIELDLAGFGVSDITESHGFCASARDRLLVGDFNGDGNDDVLCHDYGTGTLAIDHAAPDGELDGAEVVFAAPGWCLSDQAQVVIGDFDGDGLDDRLCHNFGLGERRIDFANNGFLGTDAGPFAGTWCAGRFQDLHVGSLGGGPGADMLCHDRRSGLIQVDVDATSAELRAGAPLFGDVDFEIPAFCNDGDSRLYVARVSGSRLDDIVCFNTDDGTFAVDRRTGADPRVRSGRVDGDQRVVHRRARAPAVRRRRRRRVRRRGVYRPRQRCAIDRLFGRPERVLRRTRSQPRLVVHQPGGRGALERRTAKLPLPVGPAISWAALLLAQMRLHPRSSRLAQKTAVLDMLGPFSGSAL